MNPPRRPPSYVTVLRYEDGDKAVMVLGNSKSKKSEVLLIAFRALSGMKPSSDGKIPAGSPITGMSGFITSPYAPNEGYIDVRGYKSGAEVKDPYTGNMITVP
jgi:hypothetical protein